MISPTRSVTAAIQVSVSTGASLIQGRDGNFYGSSYAGGAHSFGVIFEVTSGGSYSALYSFTGADDGALVSYVNAHLRDLREPFLAVVHLSNTHMPYAIDEADAPAFAPPACSEVRPGNAPMTSVPQELKMRLMACSNPEPKASRMTTVAMPQAIPSMVRVVRRRLCCIAP